MRYAQLLFCVVLCAVASIVAACGGGASSRIMPMLSNQLESNPKASLGSYGADVAYRVPTGEYTAARMAIQIVGLPDRQAPYFFGLNIPFRQRHSVFVRISAIESYVNMNGGGVFAYKGSSSALGVTKCPASGTLPGTIAGCCPKNATLACTAGFPLAIGDTYTLVVAFVKKTGQTELWNAQVEERKRHSTFELGSFKVPVSWGLLHLSNNNYQFNASATYYNYLGSLQSCHQTPYAHVILRNPVATKRGGSVESAIMGTSIGPPSCKSNVVIHGGGEHSKSVDLQMGYGWRPGNTPKPSPSAPLGNPVFTPLPMPSSSPAHLSDPIVVGAAQQVIAGGTNGLVDFPDEAISYLQFTSGTNRMWIDAGTPGGGEGAMYLFSFTNIDTLTLTPPHFPYAQSVYNTIDPGTERFDAYYDGAGTVLPAANGHDLLMIYHGENHLWNNKDYSLESCGSGNLCYYCGVGEARSSDGGQTWTRVGQIIAGSTPKAPTPSVGGACTPSTVAVGGYLYVVYLELGGSPYANQGLALARAPLSSDGAPGAWKKYYNGSFLSDGLTGGKFTPITSIFGIPNVTFNRFLNAFVLVAVVCTSVSCPNGANAVAYATSQDLINWSPAKVLFTPPEPACQGGGNGCYPSLITPGETSSQITDRTGYIYVSNWSSNGIRGLFRYPFAIGTSSAAKNSARRINHSRGASSQGKPIEDRG